MHGEIELKGRARRVQSELKKGRKEEEIKTFECA